MLAGERLFGRISWAQRWDCRRGAAHARPRRASPENMLGYALALGCAFTCALPAPSRRFGETPTDAIAGFCASARSRSSVTWLRVNGAAGLDHRRLVIALGIGPTRRILSLGSRRQAATSGHSAYATPASTALLIVAPAEPTTTLLLAPGAGGARPRRGCGSVAAQTRCIRSLKAQARLRPSKQRAPARTMTRHDRRQPPS